MTEQDPFQDLPFDVECHHCIDNPSEDPEPTMYVDFRAGHSGFVCEPHFGMSLVHDSITAQALVSTGINRILKNWRAE